MAAADDLWNNRSFSGDSRPIYLDVPGGISSKKDLPIGGTPGASTAFGCYHCNELGRDERDRFPRRSDVDSSDAAIWRRVSVQASTHLSDLRCHSRDSADPSNDAALVDAPA